MSRSLLQRISKAALVAAAAMARRRQDALANSTAFKAAAVPRAGHDKPGRDEDFFVLIFSNKLCLSDRDRSLPVCCLAAPPSSARLLLTKLRRVSCCLPLCWFSLEVLLCALLSRA
jgi:hypothetical protein